jgi:hypothetical protein
MCSAFPLTLNGPGRATGIISQRTKFALLLIGQLPRSASVPAFEKTDQSTFIPALAPILNSVEMDLKLIGHLLQR